MFFICFYMFVVGPRSVGANHSSAKLWACSTARVIGDDQMRQVGVLASDRLLLI